MSPFGPFYPPVLQRAVIHAERLSGVLARVPIAGADDTDTAWMVGRADEIACFVRAVVRDWRAGRVGDTRAAIAIGAYVDVLHAGLAHHLGVENLACCSLPDTTSRPVTCDARTLVAPVFGSRRHSSETTPGVDALLVALERAPRTLASPARHSCLRAIGA